MEQLQFYSLFITAETLNNDIDDQEPKPSSIPLISAIIITILTIIIAAISIIIIILVIYKRRTKKKIGAFDHINNGHDPNHNGVEMNQFQVVQNAGQRAINVVDIEDHDDDQVKCK